MTLCRLCSNVAQPFYKDTRIFYICSRCGLIFTDRLLEAEEEKRHYVSQHDNEYDWLNFARQLESMFGEKHGEYRIMDYGSGSGKLTDALRVMGYKVDSYEPMYDGIFEANKYNKYDFIVLNEVIEHVVNIKEVLTDLYYLLKPKGRLFIKTLLTDDLIKNDSMFERLFDEWWYKNDFTHVSFFSTITFTYVTNNIFPDLKIILIGKGLVVMEFAQYD